MQSNPLLMALNRFRPQNRSSSSIKHFSKSATEIKAVISLLKDSHYSPCAVRNFQKLFFFLFPNWPTICVGFDLPISLQNDTDKISYFLLKHLARLRRLLPQQVVKLSIYAFRIVWDNSYFYFLGIQDSALNKLQDADTAAVEKSIELIFTTPRDKY